MGNGKEKISKGYRLKPATHEKIRKIKTILNADSDHVINKACEILLNVLDKNLTKKL